MRECLQRVMQSVRIRRTPETERCRVADAIGEVYGFTTSSVTGVDVIGDRNKDFPSAFIEKRQQQLWLADAVLEYLEHGPSLEATFAGRQMVYKNGHWYDAEQRQ